MWRIGGIAAIFVGMWSSSYGAELSIRLSNLSGAVLADAVVFDSKARVGPGSAESRKRQTIVQRGRVFEPFVTVVEKGTSILFPNDDPMLHHVYSFSPAKHFEIKLYKGTPAAPILFDKTGVVALGCNVHDWMLAYVLVVDTPIFERSGKDGVAHLRPIAAGTYDLMVWYPGMREPVRLQSITLAATESASIDHRLDVAIKTRPKAPPFDPARYSRLRGYRSIPGGDICMADRS